MDSLEETSMSKLETEPIEVSNEPLETKELLENKEPMENNEPMETNEPMEEPRDSIMDELEASMSKLVLEPRDEPNTIKYNITYVHKIENFSFGNLPESTMIEIYKDGRAFSHFIESWLAINYPLTHVKGCKDHDHTDIHNENIKYDQKTFTKQGCKFMPSNMIGTGRKLDKSVLAEKSKKLIYIIVSNVNFPEIKVKFVKGTDLIASYPGGVVPSKDFVKFFE